MTTSIDRLSKPSTVFLSLAGGAGTAALADDASQYRTDLTDATTFAHESPSVRAALTYPRAVSVLCDLNRDDEGTLVDHGDGAGSSSYRIYIAGSGLIQCYEDTNVRISGTLPGIDGATRRYLIHWASRLEGSAVKTELLLVSLTSSAVAYAAASHAPGTTSEAYNLAINADGLGGGDDIPTDRYRAVRIDRRYVACVEAQEDFIAETTPPTVTMVRRDAPLVPDRATLGVADDGALAGPAWLVSGAAIRDSDRRLVGAIVNARTPDPLEITDEYEPAAWWRLAPGSSTLRTSIAHLWHAPVPGQVSRARVRLHVRQACSSDTVCAEVRYRAYSIAGLPWAGEPAGPAPTYYSTATATLTTDHGTGAGEWLDLGDLRLAVDEWGFTSIAIAVEIDPDDPLAPDTSAWIAAVTVEPFAPADGGGLPLDLP